MSKKYDIVVIGAGPAGLMAAKTAAKMGLTVLLVEQKQNVAEITRSCCSMFILDLGFHGESVKIDGNRIRFLRNEFSLEYSGEWVDLARSIRFSPSGYTFTLGKAHALPFAKVIEKEVLLENLLRDVVNAGVELQHRTIGINAAITSNGTKMMLKQMGRTFTVMGKVTIAADSGNSRIVESLGLNTQRRVFGAGNIVSNFLENVDCPYPHSFIRFMGGKTQSRAYMLPKPPKNKGDPILYEILTSSDELFRQIIHSEKYFSWFKNSQIIRRRAASGVLRAPIKTPVIGRVMVIGDAASWQEVEIQGALMCGYRSAHAAAQELEKGGDALQQYTHFWNCAFEFCWPTTIERSMKFFRMHNALFTDEEMDYLYLLTQNDKVPGTVNHFRAGAYELGTYVKHLKRIRSEKPGIARKLVELQKILNNH